MTDRHPDGELGARAGCYLCGNLVPPSTLDRGVCLRCWGALPAEQLETAARRHAELTAGRSPRGLVPDLVIVDDPWLPAAGVELDGPRQQGRGYLTAEQAAAAVAAIRPVPMPPATRDQLRRQIARWADDGGRVNDPRDLPPLTLTIAPDATAFFESLARAGQHALDAFRQLAAAFVGAGRQFGRALGIAGPWTDPAARCWPHDTVPTRWRDWLPATERKVDRARREHLDRQLRTLARRAARRRRNRARKAAPFYAIARAGLHGTAGLDVLRTAAAGAR